MAWNFIWCLIPHAKQREVDMQFNSKFAIWTNIFCKLYKYMRPVWFGNISGCLLARAQRSQWTCNSSPCLPGMHLHLHHTLLHWAFVWLFSSDFDFSPVCTAFDFSPLCSTFDFSPVCSAVKCASFHCSAGQEMQNCTDRTFICWQLIERIFNRDGQLQKHEKGESLVWVKTHKTNRNGQPKQKGSAYLHIVYVQISA